MKSKHSINAWQEGVKLQEQINELSMRLPKTELLSLPNQMRNEAYSLVSNISRASETRDYGAILDDLESALHSLDSIRDQIQECRQGRYCTMKESMQLLMQCDRVAQKINLFIQTL